MGRCRALSSCPQWASAHYVGDEWPCVGKMAQQKKGSLHDAHIKILALPS